MATGTVEDPAPSRGRRRLERRTVRELRCGTLLAAALTGCAALLSACTVGSRVPEAEEPLNVVLVTIDTLRADHVGVYGYERETTPVLDALARQGVRFAQAVSTSSWTLPAHASLLTGLYPAEHGVDRDSTSLPPSSFTLAEALRAAGYRTFAAVSHTYLSRRWRFDQGFEAFDESAAQGLPQHPVAERVIDAALERLNRLQEREDSRDSPFFFWLHIFDPHWDYAPPPPYDSMFDPDYDGQIDGTYASISPYIKAVRRAGPPPLPLSERDLEHLEALYDGEIRYADTHLGRLFDTLKAHGLWDRTLIVVTSDHGEEFLEHGSLEGHQWTLYEEVVMVPFVLRAPSGLCAVRRGGRVVDRQVSTVAVAGTILDCLGLDHDMRTLAALITDRPKDRGDPDVSHVDEALLDLTVRHATRLTGLRTPEWKLVRSASGLAELYHKPAEGEQRNLAAEHAARTVSMSKRVAQLLGTLNRLPDAGIERRALDELTRERLRATGYLR